MITSIGIIASYPTIDKIAKEKEKEYSYFEGYEFTGIMKGISYKAFYDTMRTSGEETVTPFEILVKETSKGRRDEHAINYFNSLVEDYTQEYLNVDYFAINPKEKISVTNIEGIEVLENGNLAC